LVVSYKICSSFWNENRDEQLVTTKQQNDNHIRGDLIQSIFFFFVYNIFLVIILKFFCHLLIFESFGMKPEKYEIKVLRQQKSTGSIKHF